ncbi:PEPxxWA-CTERM sorting domain-containing protein [Kordiimonas sp. SCSIO 12610]|uniref:PEPxxWA-CTERM sorting domain-containing protein n=1 Tax=Kordiimonas sp. SCSIO 12610 TaxID=2829597 RepID=UPI0021095DA0|nr:PEPxxWA-CTERM sorting domain-containing protein [Kordiimonas sp. SCSIO 12610]UTW56561.1 PEP-CTERM sorting domain-containing protein [Kordiimonas sp. SCSIO 12610]
MKLSSLKTTLIGAAALAGALFTGAANASSTTFDLTGDATSFETFETTNFTATLVFDDAVSDDDGSFQSSYEFSSLTFTIGANVFSFGADITNFVTIGDIFGENFISIDAFNATDVLTIAGDNIGGSGSDFTGTDLANITSISSLNTFGILTTATDSFDLTNIRAAAVSAVPEPATWLMMIFGFSLTGVALQRRRRAITAA